MIITLNLALNNKTNSNPPRFNSHWNSRLSFGMARIAYNSEIAKSRLLTNAKQTVPYSVLKKYATDLADILKKKLCEFDTPKIISLRFKILMGKYKRPAFLDAPKRVQYKKESAQKIYESLLQKDKPSQEKQAFIVFGLPASGKTTGVVPLLSKEYNAMVFDGDRSRIILPDYKDKMGNPHFKAELKEIEKMAIGKAIQKGYNFIHNIVYREKTCKPLEAYLKRLKDNGYNVHLVFVDISPKKAATRARKRFEQTGRFLDPYEILSMGKKYRLLYSKLKTKGNFDSYTRYSTDVPAGQSAKRI